MSGMGKSSSPQLVGYGYYVGFAYAFCGESDRIRQVYRAGDLIYEGSVGNGGLVYARYGDKGDPYASNGSAQGYGVFYNGLQTVVNSYLADRVDNQLAYTGTTYMSFPQPFIGDNVQALPNLEAVIERLTLGTPIPNETMGRDINPIAAIYYMLNTLMQVPDARIDLDAFISAGEVCFNENRGISLVLSRAKSIVDWINLILNHCDGVLVVDAFTGQYRVKLVRGDYIRETLPIIHEEDCTKLELIRKTWLDMYSTFIFKYTDYNIGYQENSVEYVNTAAIRILGQNRAKTQSFTLFTSAESMQSSVDSYMRNNSYPLASIKLTTNIIDFPNINAGDLFVLEAPSLNIADMVFRVRDIGGDKEGDINVEIQATEDIFGLTINIPPVSDIPIGSGIDYNIGEIEYADVKATSRETSAYATVTPVYVAPSGYGTTKFLTPDGLAAPLQPWVLGELVNPYTPTWQKGELTIGQPILLQNISGLFEVNATSDAFARLQYSGFIGDEAIGFGSLVQVDGQLDTWELDNIVHNIAGTPNDAAATIPAGTKVWITSTPARDIINVEIEPNEAQAITYHFQTSNRKETNIAFPVSYLYTGNHNRPYPASSLEIFGTQILWTPSYPFSGANYRSAENIVAGEDEGLAYGKEGYYEVFEVNSAGTILNQIGTVESGIVRLPFRFTHGLAVGKYVGVHAIGESGKASIMKYVKV